MRISVKKWLFWGILWTMIFPLVGVVVSIKFNYPDWLGGTSWLTWGRIRPMHVNGVIFGAFSTTFFGCVFYMVPKLTGIRMVGEKMGYWCLWLWNIGIVLGSYSLMAGYQKGIEAGDYALWADVPLIIAFIVLTYMVLATIVKRKEKMMYVALYYTAGAMVWTAINFPIGNILLPYWVPGVNNAALHGLYIHYIVGLWITPAGLALIYFFLPLACKNPLYSHKLSLVGFWSIAFFYPFVGIHHYLYSPIPNWTQTIAIVTSMMLIIPVWTVTQNFFGTMMGNWKSLQESFVAKFCIMGSIFYFLGCFQGSTEALARDATAHPLHRFRDFTFASHDLRDIRRLVDGRHVLRLAARHGSRVMEQEAGHVALLAHRRQLQHDGRRAHSDGAVAGHDVDGFSGLRRHSRGHEALLVRSNALGHWHGHRHFPLHDQHVYDGRRTFSAPGNGAREGIRASGGGLKCKTNASTHSLWVWRLCSWGPQSSSWDCCPGWDARMRPPL